MSSRRVYANIIFFLYVFFYSLQPLHSANKETQEEKMAEAFLDELLFQEGGCYTLLGDKPITSVLIFKGTPEDFFIENLSQEAVKTLTFTDSHIIENFEAWKRITNGLHFHNFFLVEVPLPDDPSSAVLYFVNIAATKEVLDKHCSLLKNDTSISWEWVLEQLKQPNPTFWNTLLKDHYLSGFLYGYGQENIEMFCSNKQNKTASESFEGTPTQNSFPLPCFAAAIKDVTSSKYRKQRKKIKKAYHGKKILETTLQTLLIENPI